MECPNCGSSNLKRGNGNMWCAACGFFPVPYPVKQTTLIDNTPRDPKQLMSLYDGPIKEGDNAAQARVQ